MGGRGDEGEKRAFFQRREAILEETDRSLEYIFEAGLPKMRETMESRATLMFVKVPRTWIFLPKMNANNNTRERT
jgi:hypothetical protein